MGLIGKKIMNYAIVFSENWSREIHEKDPKL